MNCLTNIVPTSRVILNKLVGYIQYNFQYRILQNFQIPHVLGIFFFWLFVIPNLLHGEGEMRLDPKMQRRASKTSTA